METAGSGASTGQAGVAGQAAGLLQQRDVARVFVGKVWRSLSRQSRRLFHLTPGQRP